MNPLPSPQAPSTFWTWPGGATLEAPAACGAALAVALGMHAAPSQRADVRVCSTADRPPRAWRTAGGFEVAPDGDDVWIARRDRLRVTGVRTALLDPAAPVQLDFDTAMPPRALLRPWLHWRALERGLAPVHATAFVWRGAGIIVAGESGAGKTAILLAALALGAQLVASEWPLLAGEPGATVYGDGEPLRIRAWHLHAVPEIAPQLTAGERRRLQRHARWAAYAGSLPGLGALGTRLGRRAFKDVAPERFASRTTSCTLRHVLLVRKGDAPGAPSQAVSPAGAALRLAEWARHDDAALLAVAAACGITTPRFEALFERRRAVLTQALAHADCRTLEVPRRGLAAAFAQWSGTI